MKFLPFVLCLFFLSCAHQISPKMRRPSQLETFPRITSSYKNPCFIDDPRDGYTEKSVFDCRSDHSSRSPAGFTIRTSPEHPYFKDVNPYGSLSKPYRHVEFRSVDQALNETFLYLNDISQGPDSHDVKSMVFLLPRYAPPKINVSGNQLVATLTTGEEVIFEIETGAIVQGALKEGPPDFNRDRFKRKPPQVDYIGSGIIIRLNHRFETPTIGAETADVQQGSRTCKVARGDLFDKEGKLLTRSDEALLAIINQKCPTKPGESAFHLPEK